MTGESRCRKCGHKPTWHGITFCDITVVGNGKRLQCDCDGWAEAEEEPQEEA